MSKASSNDTLAHAVVVPNSDIFVDAVAADPSAPSAPSLQQFQNEGGAREFLSAHGFPQGLQDSFIDALSKLPLRFFIVDDSGSMATSDGKKVTVSGGKKA